MAGAGDLYLLCREYLEAVSESLSLAPGGPTAVGYVSPGPPAWDCCDQLTVHAGGPAEADTQPLGPPLQVGFRIVDPGRVTLVALTATVLRCVPTITPQGTPPAAKLEAAAAVTLGDVWAIWNHLASRLRARTLFARPDGEPREFVFDPAIALNTSGGCAGWQVPVRVELDGYA